LPNITQHLCIEIISICSVYLIIQKFILYCI